MNKKRAPKYKRVLDTRIRHLENQCEVIKEQYEIRIGEYYKILDKISQANQHLQQEIDKRKKAEEALRKTCDELETRIQERTLVVNKLKKEIIERKQVEAALKQSEERYLSFVQNFQGIAFQADTEFRKPIFMHGTVKQITGYTEQEFVSGNILWYNIIHPDDLQYVNKYNKKLSTVLNYLCNLEYRIVHKNNKIKWIRLICTNICDESGTPIWIQGAVYDITEFKKATEQAELQQQQLIQADKMASLGILVSGVAHEINNPNHFILSNSALLERIWKDIKPIIEEYYREHGDFAIGSMPYSEMKDNIPLLFSGILEGSERIKSIVMELRDYARQTTVEMNDNVDMSAVVKSAVLLLSNMIKKSTSHFTTELSENLPLFKGNFRRLEQVMVNLIQNACQALPNNTRGIYVTTSYDKEDGSIVVDIRDEGIGISKDAMKYITDPFFTTKRDIGGTGLGLSIAHRIINDYGGSMTFHSSVGKGTTATVRLLVNKVNWDTITKNTRQERAHS